MTVPADSLHVGFVLSSLTGGGAERAVLTLAQSLIEGGHKVDLALGRLIGSYRSVIPKGIRLYHTRLWNSDGELARHCREQGIPVNGIAINPLGAARAWLSIRRRSGGAHVPWKTAVFAWVIAQYIRRARPRILAPASAIIPAVYGAELAGRSVPVVAAEHSNVSLRLTRDQLSEARAVYPRAEAVVAVSKGAAAEARRSLGLKAERVRAIYNPVPAGEIWRLAHEEASHPWFKDGGPPIIISVGREAPVGETASKDYHTLIEAFALARQRLTARLVIIGNLSESYRMRLTVQARTLGVEGDLGFIGFDENPYRFMRRAGLLVLSSVREGLPTVLIEALACGTPVVSSDAPYGPREILERGRWGRLTPVGDASALAEAMVETLEGDRPPEEALRRRAADFSCERAAGEYLRLFRKVARRT